MKRFLLTLLTFALIVGCTAETPTVTPTDLPDTDPLADAPPPATLEIGGTVQTAGVGTYCWSGASVAACVDKIGIPTAPDPLKTSSPVTALLTLPLEQPPTQVSLTIFPAADNELPDTFGGYRWWSFVEGYISMLEPQTEQDIQAELEPGLYIFYVFVVWEGKGDVSYGFLVEVE